MRNDPLGDSMIKNTDLRWLLILSSLSFILGSAPVEAKKVYRWLDEQGDTYFSDQVPPGQIQHSRATLSQTGRVLEVTEPAQSKEQIEQEKRLQELRTQQEKLIASQKIHDKALLSSYHSKEDMLLAIQAKMSIFDKQKDVIEGSIDRLTEQLNNQRQAIQSHESAAQPVPKALVDEVQLSQTRLEQAQTTLRSHLEKQEKTKKVDEADVARFLFLTQTTKDLESLPSRFTNEGNGTLVGSTMTFFAPLMWATCARILLPAKIKSTDLQTRENLLLNFPLNV